MNSLLLLGLFGSIAIGGLASLKAGYQERMRANLSAYRLSFPRNLEVEAVASALSGVGGMLLPWWKRWLAAPYISVEVHATKSGISHYLVVPEGWSQTAMNILEASLPSVRFEAVELPEVKVRTAVEYRLSSQNRLLNADPKTMSARLLANLQPLESSETVVVQWLLAPHGPVSPVKTSSSSKGTDGRLISASTLDSELTSALRKKLDGPLILASGRIGVQGPTRWRELRHLRQVEAAWHEARAPGVHVTRRFRLERSVARSMKTRRTPFSDWPARLSAEEASGLIGWPIDLVAMPGLTLGGCRQIAPSPLVPEIGTVLADSTYPGNQRPMAVGLDARLRHLHALGPTGTGKSTMLANIAAADMAAGRGLILLDPKNDLVETVLGLVPDFRRDDVILFNAADDEFPVGLNPLQAAGGMSSEVVVENLVGTIKNMNKSSWGPRLDDILRAALLTLAGVPGATLCEVPLLLSDPNYRRRIVGQIDDPAGLEGFWGWYEALSDAERAMVIGPVLNKIRALTMRPRLRGIIGQSSPRLRMADVLSEGKILLCSLSAGTLGEEAAALLGSLLMAEIWHATTARAGLPLSQRPPVMAILDEFQNYVSLTTSMSSMLAEARGLGPLCVNLQ